MSKSHVLFSVCVCKPATSLAGLNKKIKPIHQENQKRNSLVFLIWLNLLTYFCAKDPNPCTKISLSKFQSIHATVLQEYSPSCFIHITSLKPGLKPSVSTSSPLVSTKKQNSMLVKQFYNTIQRRVRYRQQVQSVFLFLCSHHFPSTRYGFSSRPKRKTLPKVDDESRPTECPTSPPPTFVPETFQEFQICYFRIQMTLHGEDPRPRFVPP